MYQFENHLESFDLHQEHDVGHEDGLIPQEVIEVIGREKLIFCSNNNERILEDCSYIWVNSNYCGQLSPGQQKAYEILLAIQEGSIYSVTTIAKLAEAQGLANPLSCSARLTNLQSLRAISGYRR